ncbi:MAG: nucleotidyltransferase family protein [Patescibacteria group bacterium]
MMSLEEIKQKTIPILREAGVTKSSIFGSYTRNEQNEESDIDILVELSQGKSLFDLVRLQLELEKSLQKKVDLVDFGSIKPQLKNYILDHQVKIL